MAASVIPISVAADNTKHPQCPVSACRQPAKRPKQRPGRDREPGPRHRDRQAPNRGPTQRAPGPDTEIRGPTQRALRHDRDTESERMPEPDTERAATPRAAGERRARYRLKQKLHKTTPLSLPTHAQISAGLSTVQRSRGRVFLWRTIA